ncbi:MAG: GGDEF domain-containing protein [Rudaea sp.]|uniref:GGDEF domain-containing protein n=1 Tax=unclassified Rudaea TaxID=2627037 RepID=UPI0010F45153|nr:MULTISPECIES: GGDEF domain-containing protein [unclassified Rudaea]MBN8887247.1 GGDEF domain-containing protein [Rudaea sp.]
MTRRPLLFVSALAMCVPIARHVSAQIVPAVDPEQAAISQCMQQMGRAPQEAEQMAEKRLAAGRLSAFSEIGWLGCLGTAKGLIGKPAESSAIADRTQALTDAHWSEFNDTQKFLSLTAIGSMLQTSGDVVRATGFFIRAYELSAAESMVQYRINAAVAISTVYFGLDAPEAADRYIRKAYELSQGHARNQPWIDYNFSFNLMKMKRYDEALVAFDKLAQHLDQAQGDALLRNRVNTQRAVIFDTQGRHEEAAALLDASLAGQREIKDMQGQSYTLSRIAERRWNGGERDSALSTAQQAFGLAEQGNYRQEKEDALRLLATIYAGMDKPQQAFDALKQADAITLGTLKAQNLRDVVAVDAAIKARNDAAKSNNGELTRATPLLLGGAALSVLLAVAASVLWLRARHRIRRLRGIDPLTGLPNRSAAIARFAAASADAAAGAREALLLIAVDKLDAINDLYGYEVGDRVLRQLARRVRTLGGANDFAARWSEDSFLVALGGATFEEANARADALRRLVEEGGIDLSDGDAVKIGISIGVASNPFFPDGTTHDWHDALRLAARALQSARQAGANAWAGIWGVAAKDGGSTLTIARAPQQAAESGQVRLEASSPLAWQS